jgi:glycosyltransferase involved in cell wall biosynthesis
VAKHFPAAVELVAVNDTAKWAEAIERLLIGAPVNQSTQLKTFEEIFSWEAQEKKLLKLVEAALV